MRAVEEWQAPSERSTIITVTTSARVRATVLVHDAHEPVVALNAAILGTPLEGAARAWAATVIHRDEPGFYALTACARLLS
jgi:hypothetical protein